METDTQDNTHPKIANRVLGLRLMIFTNVFCRLTEKCSDYVTKADGSFDFSVPINSDSIPKNISKLIVQAIAVDHRANETSKMQQPSSKLQVSLTHSNLTSALTVARVGQSKLKCGENSITAYYSAKPGKIIINFLIARHNFF